MPCGDCKLEFLNPHCNLCLTWLKRYIAFLGNAWACVIGNASVAGRSVSPSSQEIVDCQNHFERRSTLTLKFKFYKHFSDYWVIKNWSQLSAKCIGSPSSTGLLAVTDKFVSREACFSPKWPAMAMCTYDVHLNCWAVSFRLPFDNSSVASLQ